MTRWGVVVSILTIAVGPVVGGKASAATTPQPISWLAAGDSYSGGFGRLNPSFPGTGCSRDDPAGWPFIAQAQVAAMRPVTRFDDVGCTHAKLSDLFSDTGKGQWDGATRYNLVTVTAGADDAGFLPALTACIAGSPASPDGFHWLTDPLPGCPPDRVVKNTTAVLVDSYPTFLGDLARRVVAPGGNVVVVGYPAVFEAPQLWNTTASLIGFCDGINVTEAIRIRRWAHTLNDAIRHAVALANDQHPNGVHFTFIDVQDGTGNPSPDHSDPTHNPNLFEPQGSAHRHNLCGSDSWMSGPHGDGIPLNLRGHAAEAALVAPIVTSLDWTTLDTIYGAVLPPKTCEWVRQYFYLPRSLRLVDGEVQGFGPTQGGIGIDTSTPFVVGDLDGDGQEDTTTIIYCTAGGSGFTTEPLVFFGSGRITRVPLGKGVKPTWEFLVRSMRLRNGALIINYPSGEADEPTCCGSRSITDVYKFVDGNFVVEKRTIVDAASVGRSVLAYANSNDPRLYRLATPQVADNLRAWAGNGHLTGCSSSLLLEGTSNRGCRFTDGSLAYQLVLKPQEIGVWYAVETFPLGGR
jgi:hypothetical protein